jgi:hypothetical protein
MRVFRKSPKWNLYAVSFRERAYPVTVYYLANKETGEVYCNEFSADGTLSIYLKDIVDWMNDRYEPPKPAVVNGWNPLI